MIYRAVAVGGKVVVAVDDVEEAVEVAEEDEWREVEDSEHVERERFRPNPT